ncbi:MAG: MCE family protein [Desulforhopalus sp.]|nr:MCE family protein [Desulforhopalus sp.]
MIALLVALVLGGGSYGLWQLYQQENSITVVFADANGLSPGTGVWMAGVEIGKVQQLQIAGDGVALSIFLKKEVREQLTDHALFVIDPGADRNSTPVVRVKAGAGGVAPLPAKVRLKGVNSYALWQLNDYSQKVFEFINEPQLQEGIKRLEQLGSELKGGEPQK